MIRIISPWSTGAIGYMLGYLLSELVQLKLNIGASDTIVSGDDSWGISQDITSQQTHQQLNNRIDGILLAVIY
jgi:hypothetical protein